MSIKKIFDFDDSSRGIETSEVVEAKKTPTLTEQEVFDILSGGYSDLNSEFRKEAFRLGKLILREAKADVMDFRVRYNSSPNLRLELKDDYYDKRDKFIRWKTLIANVKEI